MINNVGSPDGGGGGRRRTRSNGRERSVPQSWVVSAILGTVVVTGLLVLQASGLLAMLGDDMSQGAIHWMAVIAGVLIVIVAFAWEHQVD